MRTGMFVHSSATLTNVTFERMITKYILQNYIQSGPKKVSLIIFAILPANMSAVTFTLLTIMHVTLYGPCLKVIPTILNITLLTVWVWHHTVSWQRRQSCQRNNHDRYKTRVMGLSSSEDRMIVAGVVLTQCQRLTDGRTDRRTDGRTDLR